MRDNRVSVKNNLYKEDLDYISNIDINWSKLDKKTVFITGATGLIGTVIVDAIMLKNSSSNINIKVAILSRNLKSIEDKFKEYIGNSMFSYVIGDVTDEIKTKEKIDFIIHLASNTHPALYSAEPIRTIDTIVRGTKNILELACANNVERVINASSVEVYGENYGDTESFSEDYCGYIDCNTLRAGYPEGKRLSEALCQAYISERKSDIISARLGRVYGPTIKEDDTKSTSQFINSSVKGLDIILKSQGTQRYSYVYVADAVAAILFLVDKGINGEAYNVCSDEVKSLREVAGILSAINNKQVVFEVPSGKEKQGFSVVQNALMDTKKIKGIGWTPQYELGDGLRRTVLILRGQYDEAE